MQDRNISTSRWVVIQVYDIPLSLSNTDYLNFLTNKIMTNTGENILSVADMDDLPLRPQSYLDWFLVELAQLITLALWS